MLDRISQHTFYPAPLNAETMVVDLGAAAGDFALAISEKYGCRAHCVEAVSRNFALCGQSDLVTKHHFAVGNINGPVELNLMRDHETPWGTTETFHGRASEGAETVPGITLEMLLVHINAPERVALLKVDIEGAEIAMFDSTDDETLRRFDQITVEFHDFMDKARTPDVRRVIRRLKSLGFSAIVFTHRFHGDVLFLNSATLSVGPLRLLIMRTVYKYTLGIGRMLARLLKR